jgi:hypothetical protein
MFGRGSPNCCFSAEAAPMPPHVRAWKPELLLRVCENNPSVDGLHLHLVVYATYAY